MNIDAFINETVKAHNRTCCDIIVSKSYKGSWACYFLYLKDYDIWEIEELSFYKFLWDRLSEENILPCIRMREIDGKTKIGIAFEVKL